MLPHKKGKTMIIDNGKPSLSSTYFARALSCSLSKKSYNRFYCNCSILHWLAFDIICQNCVLCCNCILAPSFSAGAVFRMEAPATQAFRQIAYWTKLHQNMVMMMIYIMILNREEKPRHFSNWQIGENCTRSRSRSS